MPNALPRSAEGGGPRASGHLAEQLIAHARDLILLVAPDATLQYASPAAEWVLGARPETLVGRPLADLVHAADRRAVLSALAEVRSAADRTASAVCRCRHADGGWRTLDASLRRAHGALGLAGVVVVSTRDVTDRARLVDVLERVQRMALAGLVADALAFDLRNMLRVVSASSSLMRSALRAGTSPEEDLEAIEAAAARMRRLVQHLRGADTPAAPEVLDLGRILRHLEPLLRRLARRRMRVVSAVEVDRYRLRAERGLLEQMLVNVAVHARDATRSAGTLFIGAANVELTADDIDRRGDAIAPGSYVRLTMCGTTRGADRPAALRAAGAPDGRDSAAELDTDQETAFAIARSLVARMGGTMTIVAVRTESTCVEIHLPATRIPSP
jgi:PAS domain S-box-containing protein